MILLNNLLISIKRFIICFLLIFIVLALAGCINKKETKPVSNENKSAKVIKYNLSKEEAMSVARKELGGNILQAIPFVYKEKQLIAVRRSEKDSDFTHNVLIIELNGTSYKKIWQAPESPTSNFDDLKFKLFTVENLNNDNQPELVYMDRNFGTLSGSTEVFVYSLKNEQTYSIIITESVNYQESTGQVVEISENLKLAENKLIMEWLKKRLKDLNILREPKDPKKIPALSTDPKLSEERWIQENSLKNGELKNKKIQIHWYNGEPPNVGDIQSEVTDGHMIYRTYFKSGVYAIDIKKKRFYVVYASDATVVDWIDKLQLNGNQLKIQHKYGDVYFFNTKSQEIVKGE